MDVREEPSYGAGRGALRTVGRSAAAVLAAVLLAVVMAVLGAGISAPTAQAADQEGSPSGFGQAVSLSDASPLDAVVSADDAVKISNEEELLKFAQRVNNGERNIDALVTADIECDFTSSKESTAWPTIGTRTSTGTVNYYSGTFDGGGHTISGLNTYYQQFGVGDYGLIGCANGATIKNVTIADSYMRGYYSGALVGDAAKCTIENCGVDSSVYIESIGGVAFNTGSLVGLASAGTTISNCWTAVSRGSGCKALIGGADATVSVTNCSVGSFNADGVSGSQPVIASPEGTTTDAFGNTLVSGDPTVKAVYYVEDCTSGDQVTGCVACTYEDMGASGYVVGSLNDWVKDANASGGDYESWAVERGSMIPTLYGAIVPAKAFVIEYVLGGGTNNPSNPETVTGSSDAVKLADPTRAGCTFLGWYTDGAYENQITEIPENLSAGMTIYARWDNSAFEADSDGAYLIPTAEVLQEFCDEENLGNPGIDGRVTADIDMGDEPLPMLGIELAYTGTFDGAGHTVTFSSFDTGGPAIGMYETYGMGFVHFLGGGTLTGLTLESTEPITTTETDIVGVFVCTATNNSTVSDCVSKVSVKSGVSTSRVAGGIVYQASNCTIERCANYGTIKGYTSSSGILAVDSNTTISECANHGDISGESYAAGLVVSTGGSSLPVSDSYNDAAITGGTSSSSYAGGLVAQSYASLTLTNSYNCGTVTGGASRYAGSVVGVTSYLSCDNVYWLKETCDRAIGTSSSAGSESDFTSVSSSELAGLASSLGDKFIDVEEAGHPFLKWEVAADTSALEALVEEAESLDESSYTPASWAALQDALAEAEAVLADPNASQADVDEAAGALQSAIDNLVEAVDKSALQALADEASSLDGSSYTPASWADLEDALTAAEAVLADGNASQAEVDAAAGALQSAIDNLVEAVDKSELEADIAEAEALDGSEYTPESWQALEDALAAAEAVDADADATQADVDAAAQALSEAMGALQGRFTDVWSRDEANDWYYEAVYGMAGLGIVKGYAPDYTVFGVGDPMTRADLVTILWRMSCPGDYDAYDESKAVNDTSFTDVADGTYYTGAVDWAAKEGVVTGFTGEDGTQVFSPDGDLTFEEQVTMVARLVLGADAAAAWDASVLSEPRFTDGDAVSDWAAGPMAWAVDVDLVTGGDNGDGTYTLAPAQTVARERVVTVLWRAVTTGTITAG